MIFSYLSIFDVHRAFRDLKNIRIECLLHSTRRSLNVSLMRRQRILDFFKRLIVILLNLIRFGISVHTMILEVEIGMDLKINLISKKKMI